MPDVAGTGHSFAGAIAYAMHDKRQEPGPHPTTRERVAWTETRNLATDDPAVAQRIMIATARQADALKAAAGIKATGRKATAGPVLTYSLAWHPDERSGLTREEMIRAADQSLQVLGAQNHQALIICHNDRAHPHVHLIVCRVDPATGKMLSTSNDYRKLSAWAHEYEKSRGTILTPARVRNAEARAQKRRDEPAPANRPRRDERSRDAPKEAGSGGARSGATIGVIADLKALGNAQKADHAAAWVGLSVNYRSTRATICTTFAAQMRATVARHRAEAKAVWARHDRDHRAQARHIAQQERTPLGIIALALTAARAQRAQGETMDRGFLILALANILSPKLRRATFAAAQDRDRLALANQMKMSFDAEIRAIKVARAEALDRQQRLFLQERASVIASQVEDRAKLRTAWKQATTQPRERSNPAPAPEQRQRSPSLFDQARAAKNRARDQQRGLER